MFFRRSSKESPHDAPASPPTLVSSEAPAETKAQAAKPLAASELRCSTDAKRLGFKTTADLEPADKLLGQEQALDALKLGAGITALDFNVFVSGPPASGKTTAVKAVLGKIAAAEPAPPDWVYVADFEDARRCKALKLPAGRGRRLAAGMAAAVEELKVTVPAVFEGEDYQARRRAIEEECRFEKEQALEAIHRKAAAQNIAILRTPLGFGLAPMHEGKVVRPEVFKQIPEAMRREVETRIGGLQKDLETALAKAPEADKARRLSLGALDEETARGAVEVALAEIKAEFKDLADVAAHIAAAERDLVRHAALFLPAAAGAPGDDRRFRRFMVNVLVSHAANPDGQQAGAPVHEEVHPTPENLAGSAGDDVMLVRPGALHRANGGYLVIDADKLLSSSATWASLKRALKSGVIRVETLASLEPDPIPLDVKVVLIGDDGHADHLGRDDPDFARLFKVRAAFAASVPRNKESEAAYARLIGSIVAGHGLKPVEASGVARLIEEGARLSGDREALSLAVGPLADIVCEADHWAGAAKRKTLGREDIDRAISERLRRAGRAEGSDNGGGVDAEGQKVGQVTSLTHVVHGGIAFGRPCRVTARVRMGSGRVEDLVRETRGTLKNAATLWGYLASRFVQDAPLALAASLALEIPGEAVDEGVSLAELSALLSALAEVPVRQDLGVAGIVNQQGEVQATRRINEKIEGFFDLCRARGLSGTQGVLIPRANMQHLMLREDVVEAVTADRFAVYAVATVEEAIELLTGLRAGERRTDGLYPAGTVNRLAEDKLRSFAERGRRFAAGQSGTHRNGKDGP